MLWESDPWYVPGRDPVAHMPEGRKGEKVRDAEKLTFDLKRNVDVDHKRRAFGFMETHAKSERPFFLYFNLSRCTSPSCRVTSTGAGAATVTGATASRGSTAIWPASYTFRQFIVERAKRDGWGFFTQVSFANASTSPITTFFDLGVGGNGLFTARQADEFGIAYAYTDLSTSLNIDLLPIGGRLRVEHQLELFYNVHFAPWLQLTGDLQVTRPNRPAAGTATIPGTRLRVVF